MLGGSEVVRSEREWCDDGWDCARLTSTRNEINGSNGSEEDAATEAIARPRILGARPDGAGM